MWYHASDISRSYNYDGGKLCQELTNAPKVVARN